VCNNEFIATSMYNKINTSGKVKKPTINNNAFLLASTQKAFMIGGIPTNKIITEAIVIIWV